MKTSLATAALLSTLLAACGGGSAAAPAPTPTPEPVPPRTVVYWVSGDVPKTRSYYLDESGSTTEIFPQPGWMSKVTVTGGRAGLHVHNPYSNGVVGCAILSEDEATVLDDDLGQRDLALCEVDFTDDE